MTTTWSRGALVCVLLVACSTGREANDPRVTPERPPETTPVASVTQQPAPAPAETSTAPTPAAEAEVPTTVDIDARTLARRWVREYESEDVSLEGHCVTVAPAYPPALRDRVATLLRGAAQETCRSFPEAARWEEGIRVSNLLATPTLLSVTWSASYSPTARGAWNVLVGSSRHYRIEGGELRSFELAEAIRTDVVDRIALEACREVLAEEAQAHAGESYYDLQDTECGSVLFYALESRDIGVWVEVIGSPEPLHFRLLYSALPGAIVDGGPLAEMLRIGTQHASDAPETGEAWSVSGLAPIAELAMRWVTLPASARDAVRLATEDGEQGRLVLPPGADEDAARTLASALGGEASRAPWPANPGELAIVRTTTSLNLRDEPRGMLLRVLPIGTLAVSVARDEIESGSWSRLVVTPALVGWGSSRFVEAAECWPSIDDHVAALEAPQRALARSRTLRIETRAVADRRVVRAAMFASSATDEHEHTSTRVSLRRLSNACRVGAAIGTWTFNRDLLDLQATRTERAGGEVLLLAMVGSDWRALRVGSDEPVWREYHLRVSDSSGLIAPSTRGPHGRGFWPLVTRQRGEVHAFRWDGTTLVPDDAPPPSEAPAAPPTP